MHFRGPLAAALAVVLLGAAKPAAFSAPAGDRPAGASRSHPADAILPDGRISAPLGVAMLVGTNPQGIALSPNGRYAIVSNVARDGMSAPPPPAEYAMLRDGSSLCVVDTKTMAVARVYESGDISFAGGIVAYADPANAAITVVLASDGAHNRIRVFTLGGDGTLTPSDAIEVAGSPNKIALSADGRMAYVTSLRGNSVTAIDLATRRTMHSVDVGYSPVSLTRAGSTLLVANSGLEKFEGVTPTRTPVFANVQGSEERSQTLSILPLDASGDIGGGADPSAVRLDPIPDGSAAVGGAHPTDVVVRRDGAYAYVSLANVDRVATLALSPEPRVIAGLDLRFFGGAPYGMQPGALALSKDGKNLYAALAGFNSVAVLDARDPAKLHRLGLIPTSAKPSALALSVDGHYLYIASARGVDGWGVFQRVDLKTLPLKKAVFSALRYNRTEGPAKLNTVVPPQTIPVGETKSTAIDRVVVVEVGAGTFDSLFGDAAPVAQTPNFHALASAYALADNFYRGDLDTRGADPDDYPRMGYIFNALQRANISYRDYGALVNVSGFEPTRRGARPSGLGGAFTMNVPALGALDGRIDLNFATYSPQVSNAARAAEFISDMGKLTQTDSQPAFSYVWLPTDETQLPDADRALGEIVQFLSHTAHWSSTAVFVVSNGIQNTTDHVNRARSFAMVVSPLAKPGYVGHRHLSIGSVYKTVEELLGLEPITLRDLLSSDMADFFGEAPYPSTYDVRN